MNIVITVSIMGALACMLMFMMIIGCHLLYALEHNERWKTRTRVLSIIQWITIEVPLRAVIVLCIGWAAFLLAFMILRIFA